MKQKGKFGLLDFLIVIGFVGVIYGLAVATLFDPEKPKVPQTVADSTADDEIDGATVDRIRSRIGGIDGVSNADDILETGGNFREESK